MKKKETQEGFKINFKKPKGRSSMRDLQTQPRPPMLPPMQTQPRPPMLPPMLNVPGMESSMTASAEDSTCDLANNKEITVAMTLISLGVVEADENINQQTSPSVLTITKEFDNVKNEVNDILKLLSNQSDDPNRTPNISTHKNDIMMIMSKRSGAKQEGKENFMECMKYLSENIINESSKYKILVDCLIHYFNYNEDGEPYDDDTITPQLMSIKFNNQEGFLKHFNNHCRGSADLNLYDHAIKGSLGFFKKI